MLIFRPASATLLGSHGLGATGYSCTSTVCVGTTSTVKALFHELQTQLNAVLGTIPQPPTPLVVDGKLGKNTVTAAGLVATMASSSYRSLGLPTLLTYTKPPTKEQLAANAAKIVAELKTLYAARQQESGPDPVEEALASLGPAAQAAAAAAAKAASDAAVVAEVKGEASAEAKAAQARAATAAAAASAAMDKARAIGAGGGLPGWHTDRGKLLYGLGALGLIYFGYRAHTSRHPARAAAPPASAPVAGLRGRHARRSRR